MSESGVPIEYLIKSNTDKKQIAILTHFFETHGKESKMVVTESEDFYEIILRRPHGPGFKGGVEQYYLNKKTGECHMGWHEHPMKVEDVIIQIQQDAPVDAITSDRDIR